MCFLLGIWEYSKFVPCFPSMQILGLMAGRCLCCGSAEAVIDTFVDEVVLPLWAVM